MGVGLNILFAASGSRRGSWIIRGEQIAEAMGAKAVLNPKRDDIAWADIVVAVKLLDHSIARDVHKAGKILVLDILDGWEQPKQCQMPRHEALEWIMQHIASYRPHGIVCATEAMQEDCVPSKVQSLFLDHHGRPSPPNPIREHVKIVGYEGSERYLDGWRDTIEDECKRRGWKFVVNPPGGLASIDIALALRGGKWDGYPSRNWKSGVKVENARISGTPIIALPERGAIEGGRYGVLWVNSPEDIQDAFARLVSQEERKASSSELRATALDFEYLIESYQKWLRSLQE